MLKMKTVVDAIMFSHANEICEHGVLYTCYGILYNYICQRIML
jgi:hypothetical protein